MNSPVKNYDGKSVMHDDIVRNFPTIDSYDTYLEIFGGGDSLIFHKPLGTAIEVYNDLDENVYSLFNTLSDPQLFKIFKDRCDLTYYSEQLRKEYVQSLKRDNLSIVDRAYKFFIVNRTSNNGIGSFAINPLIRRNMSKSVSDMLATVEKLPQVHQRLSKVVVTNTNAVQMLDEHNSKNVFIYADPPTHHNRKISARYVVNMSDEQRKIFVDKIINSKSKILVYGYNGEEYERLNSSKDWVRIDFNSSKDKVKTKIESLWRNYQLTNNRLFE